MNFLQYILKDLKLNYDQWAGFDYFIRESTEEWGYTLNEAFNLIQLCDLYNYFFPIQFFKYYPLYKPELEKTPDTYIPQLTKLLKLLKSCKGNSINLTGTIKNPAKNEIKGATTSIEINNPELISKIYEFLKTAYPCDLNPDKDIVVINVLSCKTKKIPRNAKIGFFVANFIKYGLLFKVFEEENKKGAKTKNYCFIYDWLTILGIEEDLEIGFSGAYINNLKQRKIRDYIKARDIYMKKIYMS